MKKALYKKHGPIPHDIIEAVTFEKPKISNNQALIEVLAAPINPSDILTLTGEYGVLPKLPAVGGNEGVGKVVETGSEVNHLKIGQTVLLPVGSGSWTTHLALEASKLIPLPNEADPLQLAMLTINPPTASLLLSEYVKLNKGDWIIQNAANSSVGSYLIQLAKIRGFKTVNIVRRESAMKSVLEIGGDVVLVDGKNLFKKVTEATNGANIALGIDAVGGDATDRLANCLCENATLVNYGAMSTQPCSISARSFIFNSVTLKGFWLAKWFQSAPQDKQFALFGDIVNHIASGTLRSNIQATFDIDHIKDAVEAASNGKRDGKILVVPNGS